jgi:hypothetical protein
MRMVDGRVYMHLAGRDGWMKADVSQLESGDASDPLSTTSDPTQFLDYLRGIADDIKVVGEQTIRGARTTHYSATVDLAKALQRQNLTPAERKQLSAIGLEDLPVMPADIWIDGDGRLRRLDLIMDFSALASGLSGGLLGPGDAPLATVSLELYDFGTPVHVEAPPAAELVPYDGTTI